MISRDTSSERGWMRPVLPAAFALVLLMSHAPAEAQVGSLAVRIEDAASLERMILEIGGELNMASDGGSLVSATLTPAQLMRVANQNTVVWIDRWTPPGLDMNNARSQSGATYVQGLDIDGKGMRVHQNEGVNTTHREFAARSPYRIRPINLPWSTPSGILMAVTVFDA